MTFHRTRASVGNGYRITGPRRAVSFAIAVRLDESEFERVRCIAERERVPIARVLRQLIAQGLLEREPYGDDGSAA